MSYLHNVVLIRLVYHGVVYDLYFQHQKHIKTFERKVFTDEVTNPCVAIQIANVINENFKGDKSKFKINFQTQYVKQSDPELIQALLILEREVKNQLAWNHQFKLA